MQAKSALTMCLETINASGAHRDGETCFPKVYKNFSAKFYAIVFPAQSTQLLSSTNTRKTPTLRLLSPRQFLSTATGCIFSSADKEHLNPQTQKQAFFGRPVFPVFYVVFWALLA